ncbi:ACP S-malonyltransferase [Brevibacterium luteolum]|uniref:ACP S-malonyltransferase n=1 Tax=Brevibacterium luteolum TaxID=199591 RepID=UPI00223B101E|nr:ACP S-malonyltransferase [Brevibacterium luteolum]MCT1657246.1 ACP S-malonyltransferase [Brevibacterium luteolum]MCT1873295.1 ACP S-malonyltransferase [Brevibacterium luteolum]MCT1889900.1 ACP S-malonyltransferase [Brevibacterium luteolum]MCT1892302.1 ACP S-malonyltransferase [Brevibacterium luteolum]MCT1923621.1 ACP S-malonyltransferase [Brevibacterium luteolum]
MLVIACPGQGAQKSGFLSSWLDRRAFAASLDALSAAADLDLRTHGTESDDETIKSTDIAQPLLVASAIAAYRELFADVDVSPDVVAGHSVGEIGAANIAGILDDTAAMKFVMTRATGMAEASAATPTGMAAVVGGEPDDVLAAIESAGLSPANVNGAGQTVAAGAVENIEKLAENPPERARVIPLKVAGAFHTSYMGSAQAPLATLASNLEAQDPQLTILTNATGEPVDSGSEYLDLLVKQVTNPVRWDLCQKQLLDMRVTGLLELVPGGTLTGLAKRAMRGVETFALKSAADLDDARAFVQAHAGQSPAES